MSLRASPIVVRLADDRPAPVRGVEPRAHCGVGWVMQSFGAGIEHVAAEVGLTPLPRAALERPLHSIHETAPVVGDQPVDPATAPVFEPRDTFVQVALGPRTPRPNPRICRQPAAFTPVAQSPLPLFT
jgi:hypothetical protein